MEEEAAARSPVRFNDVGDARSLSSKFRRKRDLRLRELITSISQKKGSVRILDVGGTVEYWRRVGLQFLRDTNASVTVLNIVETALKAEGADAKLFTPMVGDACNLDGMADGEFDLAHSNSVIEHVGNWSRMKEFGREARRVGRSYYVQTPYYWFPVDPHYYKAPMIHWMPRPIQARLLARFPLTHAGKTDSLDAAFRVLDGTQLLDRRQFKIVFPDAEIVPEVVFGLTKSLIAIRRAEV